MALNVANLFDVWLRIFSVKFRNLVMVGIAAITWTIRKFRNKACFENKLPSDTIVVVLLVCHWLKIWAILQKKEDDIEALQLGARLLEHVASEVFQALSGMETWSTKNEHARGKKMGTTMKENGMATNYSGGRGPHFG